MGRVLDAAQVLDLQQLVRQVPVSQHVALYALSLVRATRPNCEGSLDFVNRWVNWGAGTRAGQYLLLAAKTHVLLQGRFSVSCADVREYALPVLRHRIFPTFTAASEAVNPDQIVKKIVAAVKEPQYRGCVAFETCRATPHPRGATAPPARPWEGRWLRSPISDAFGLGGW